MQQRPVVIAAPAQAFYHLELLPNGATHKLGFSVKDETDIRYYIVEGSNDMVSFEAISRIYAKGASTMPRSYNATIHNTSFRYYRIRRVDNSGLHGGSNASDSKDGLPGPDLPKLGEPSTWSRMRQYA